MKKIEILTQDAQVADVADVLSHEETIAVDLEADSLHNYREKICLVQISTPQYNLLIDTLALGNLDPLQPVFADPRIRKIFHAADYDLRSLKRDFDLSVHGLFDTMICAQLLGEARIGLADLLYKYCGVTLDKKYQKADWSRRPLPEEMIRYAVADTAYLHRLAELFKAQLEALGRMGWVTEECALLESVRFAENSGPLAIRIKGAGLLSRRELGVLECLLQWREAEGARRNRPVYKIIGNKPLLELARRLPHNQEALQGIEGLPPRLVDRYGHALLTAVDRGRELAEEALPHYPRQPRRPKDPAREKRFQALRQWREKEAAVYALDPGVLINNTALDALAEARPQTRADLDRVAELKEWQKTELGEGILKVLS